MFFHTAGIQGYVLEVSHRVRRRELGFPWPTTENVALVLSQDAAEQLVAGENLAEQQAVLGEVHVYLNAKPITLRLADQALATQHGPYSSGVVGGGFTRPRKHISFCTRTL
jgi:hypothetical protein